MTSKAVAILRSEAHELRKNLEAIEGAIAVLEGSGNPRRGKKRNLSAAARKKLSEAGKKRWASVKKAK
jgi:hypothetical protein